VREMVLGDIMDADYVASLVVERTVGALTDMLVNTFPVGQFAAGGIISPPKPKTLPEGVVGFTLGGAPIYDGHWFDERMRTPNSVTIHVK